MLLLKQPHVVPIIGRLNIKEASDYYSVSTVPTSLVLSSDDIFYHIK